MIKKIFIVISFFFYLSSHLFSDETISRSNNYTYGQSNAKDGSKIITRGSGGKILKSKIKTDIEIFKKNLIKRTKAKNYSKLLGASATNISKRIKTRGGGGPIYSRYAKTVVYIGNYEGKNVGSGFLIEKPGIILTNWHVVQKADEVAVWILPDDGVPTEKKIYQDLEPLYGAVVATNKKEDLALVKVGNFPKIIKQVTIGSIKEVRVGDKVFAIGHPEGLPWTFSEGIINQIRKKKDWTYPDSEYQHTATVIQTQTPINPGNSGGPLFSENGNLIGVNTLKGPGENINFAVSVEHAVKFLKQNPNLKNINPAEIVMKKDYPNARTQDFNKNGIIDTWYLDPNKNGKYEKALVDDDEDGFIEAILYDENENGVWETQVMDDDLDGKANRAFLDENEDKKIDIIAYDDNQDGKWDRYENI